MEMHILVPVGIAIVVGFFVAAWFRHSNPVRLMDGRRRIAPTV